MSNDKNGGFRNLPREIKVTVLRTMCIVISIFALILGGMAMYFAGLPKTVPWVVELTPTGEADYLIDSISLRETWSPNDATQRYFIAHYVINLRSVSTDDNIIRSAVNDVYSRTLGNAVDMINAHYTQNNPTYLKTLQTIQVPVEDMSVTNYGENKWKVIWREITYRRSDGAIIADSQYEGIFTVEFYTPETERKARENPLGMYVTDYSIKLLRDNL